MIQIDGLSKSYNTTSTVLNNISASLTSGAIHLLYGRSGSGKTTLLNCLSGVEAVDSGELTVNGKNLQQLTANERADFRLSTIGIIYQFFNLLPSLTVRENILLPAMLQKKDQQQHLHTLAKKFEIAHLLDQWPNQISGGESQRVAICRALICQPKLILADEPTGNLDIRNRDIVMGYLNDLTQSDGLTLLIATHDHELKSYASNVWNLRGGQLTAAE